MCLPTQVSIGGVQLGSGFLGVLVRPVPNDEWLCAPHSSTATDQTRSVQTGQLVLKETRTLGELMLGTGLYLESVFCK